MVEIVQNSAELKALNTTVMLLSQKMAYIVRNEKILSKNILILNEKINKLSEKSSVKSGDFGVDSEVTDSLSSKITELYEKQKAFKQDLEYIRASIDGLKESFVTKAELQELKYIIDTINPLEFVTYQQLKDLIKK